MFSILNWPALIIWLNLKFRFRSGPSGASGRISSQSWENFAQASSGAIMPPSTSTLSDTLSSTKAWSAIISYCAASALYSSDLLLICRSCRQPLKARHALGHVMIRLLVDGEDRHVRAVEQGGII